MTEAMTERREAIIQAALGLIEADPWNPPAVRKLAEAVSMSPAALYTHFRDLDDILTHVRRHLALELFEAAQRASKECDDPAGMVDAVHGGVVDLILANPGVYRWMGFSHRLGTAGVAKQLAELAGDLFEVASDIGELIIETSYVTLSIVPVLAECEGVDRNLLVRFLNQTQVAMANTLIDGAARASEGSAVPEIPLEM